jgi:hypothetical protein
MGVDVVNNVKKEDMLVCFRAMPRLYTYLVTDQLSLNVLQTQ